MYGFGLYLKYRLLSGLGLSLLNSLTWLVKHLISFLRRWLVLELFGFGEESSIEF